jgi:hypothetical protein
MYLIGQLHGVSILADVNNSTDANVISALFKAAVEAKWAQAYADAFHALQSLNHAAGQEIAEYETPEDVQRVLGLNGKVHSIDGWDVPAPAKAPDARAHEGGCCEHGGIAGTGKDERSDR